MSSTAAPSSPASDAERRDRLGGWLDTTYMAQVATRDLAEDVRKSADTPALQAALDEVIAEARRHEERSKALLAAVGREVPKSRELAGVFTAKAREVVGNLYAFSDGTFGTWRILHQLYLDSGNSLSAWAVSHRLAEALGVEAVRAITGPVVAEKQARHDALLALVAAHAPAAVLERAPV